MRKWNGGCSAFAMRSDRSEGKGAMLRGELGGRRLNGFLGLSLNDVTILFLGILWDKTVSVG